MKKKFYTFNVCTLMTCFALSMMLTGCGGEKKTGEDHTDGLDLPGVDLPVENPTVPPVSPVDASGGQGSQSAPVTPATPELQGAMQPESVAPAPNQAAAQLNIQIDPSLVSVKAPIEHESLKSPAQFLGLAVFSENLRDPQVQLDQVFPKNGWEALQQRREYIADANTIVIEKKFFLPDSKSNLEIRKQKHYFTFSQNALASKIVEASYQLKIKESSTGRELGVVRLRPVPIDLENQRFFISMADIYKRLERISTRDVNPEDTQVLVVELRLENGQRKVISIHYHASGEVAVSRQVVPVPKPSSGRDTIKQAAEKWKVHEEVLSNPSARSFDVLVGLPSQQGGVAHSTLALTTGFQTSEMKAEGPHSGPSGPYMKAFKVTAPLDICSLMIAPMEGTVRVGEEEIGVAISKEIDLNKEPQVLVRLSAGAKVRLEWHSSPNAPKIALPEDVTRSYSWTVPQADRIETRTRQVEKERVVEGTRKETRTKQVTVTFRDPRHPAYPAFKLLQKLEAEGKKKMQSFNGVANPWDVDVEALKKFTAAQEEFNEKKNKVQIDEHYEAEVPFQVLQKYFETESFQVSVPVAPLNQSYQFTEHWKVTGVEVSGKFLREIRIFNAYDRVSLESVARGEMPSGSGESIDSSEAIAPMGGMSFDEDVAQLPAYSQPVGFLEELPRYFQ